MNRMSPGAQRGQRENQISKSWIFWWFQPSSVGAENRSRSLATGVSTLNNWATSLILEKYISERIHNFSSETLVAFHLAIENTEKENDFQRWQQQLLRKEPHLSVVCLVAGWAHPLLLQSLYILTILCESRRRISLTISIFQGRKREQRGGATCPRSPRAQYTCQNSQLLLQAMQLCPGEWCSARLFPCRRSRGEKSSSLDYRER